MNVLRTIRNRLGQFLRRQSRSLRGRLFLVLGGLVAVLLGLELMQHASRLRTRQELKHEAHQQAAATSASLITARLDDLFRAHQMIYRGMGRTSPVSAAAYLEDVRQAYPGLEWIQFARRGSPPVQAVDPGYPGYEHRDLFEAAYAADGEYVSDVEETPTQPARYVIRVVSLQKAREAGDADVLIAMEFSLEGFARLFDTKLPGSQLLVDGNGAGIFTSGPMPPASQVLSHTAVDKARKERTPQSVKIRLNEKETLTGSTARVGKLPWTLVYLEKEEREPEDIWRFLLLPLLIVVVLGVSLNLIFQIIDRPLTRLSAATRAIGTGDLGFRLERPEVEDFDALVAAFNSMAERLELIQLALVEANEKLEGEKSALDERVRAATRELQQEHDKLLRAERLSTLGLFSSAIAHDLRNPLNTVSLTVEWLRLRLADHQDEKVRARVEAIRRELQRADQIIRTLLGFARTGEPELAPTDLNQLIREVAEVVEAPEQVSVRLELDTALPEVPVDRAQLFQVLENLVRNAIQAMPEGGDVRISSRANCDSCQVTVADNGPGIPADAQEQVFEPLVSSKSSGTGLGLALARRIVEAHHGRIRLDSAPGRGARFEIELPLYPDGRPHR